MFGPPVFGELVRLLVEFIGSALRLFLSQGKLLREGVELVLGGGGCLARKPTQDAVHIPWTSFRSSATLEPGSPAPGIRVLIV